ncbi:MAG: CYTH domain-containing protein [Chrysiogenetes bacterium]|nr:CYTH domain-containing protein [Chrysiogenetes bacterium]
MPREIERKFLVRGDAWRSAATSSARFSQGYLLNTVGKSIRVRLAGAQAWLTIKAAAEGIARHEFEYPIPPEHARELLALCEGPLIEKTRHLVTIEGFVWEVDEFGGENAGLIVAEIELPDEDADFARPEWLGEEVTHDPRYLNAALVKNPFSRWA